ncbi:MAG: PfkB family carbohydrate kinase [Desulfobacterium sp.]|jgi:fructokinase|nr:PfkB family carbohydrate kinase [Desulfobacterium sp.]
MILVLGEILFDLFPDQKKIGGAPFNFAYHLKKMGVPVRFISRVGDDQLGLEIKDFLLHHGFDPRDIQTDPTHPTGTVRVFMEDGAHGFTIAADSAWDHLEFDDHLSSLVHGSPDMIYFGTLTQRTGHGQEIVRRIISEKSRETSIFCDINLRSDLYNRTTIEQSLHACNILKLSNGEAVEILALLSKQGIIQATADSPDEIIDEFIRIYGIELIILTMGERGSIWAFSGKKYRARAFPLEKIVDTVGAGDAYAAMAAFGRLKKLSVQSTMALAGEFAARICKVKGALPWDDAVYGEFYEKFQQSLHLETSLGESQPKGAE